MLIKKKKKEIHKNTVGQNYLLLASASRKLNIMTLASE